MFIATSEITKMERKSEIAVVTVPAFSHQASILEMCKRLVQVNHHLHVTCFIPTLGSPPPASLSTVRSLPSSISCTFLPPVNLDDHPDRDGLSLEVQIHLAVARSMPLVREAVVKSRAMVLVAEPLSIEALKIGKEMGILSYLYFPCSAMMLSLCFYSSKLNREVSSEFRDVPGGVIHIPGCVPVSANDLPDNHQDRSGLAYEHFLQRCQLYRLAQGILVNSFTEMEGEAIRAWEAEEDGTGEYPAVYAIGPIIRTGSSSSEPGRDTCLEWLDRQPMKSVVYVSFGSGGRLSESQTREIALGLELSGQRFLWANVKSPSDKASASYLRSNSEENEEEDALRFLPQGFMERTKDRGMVLSRWVPQVEILSHESTGAFVSHCGWNSVLESVARGVPVIAWPLFAEQRTNAVMLVEGLKVAVRPRREKEELARVIKCVMNMEEEGEGKAVRRRMREMRDAAASAVMEGGSSTTTISNLALQWTTLRTPHDDDAA